MGLQSNRVEPSNTERPLTSGWSGPLKSAAAQPQAVRRLELSPRVEGPMKRITALLLFLFTCTATAQTRSPIDLANAQVPPGARRIAYGRDPLQFGELRVPSTKGPYP